MPWLHQSRIVSAVGCVGKCRAADLMGMYFGLAEGIVFTSRGNSRRDIENRNTGNVRFATR